MSIPHARRLPIPDLFRLEPPNINNDQSKLKGTDDDGHNESDSKPRTSPPPVDPPPTTTTAHRHFMLPAPSEKKGRAKYVPFSRPSKIDTKPFARPSPTEKIISAQVPPSPAGTETSLMEASGESTLVASSPTTPDKLGLEEHLITRPETTDIIIPHEASRMDEGSSPVEGPTTANEQGVLTAVSDCEGNMNLDADTAHLETAASLRSIRGTLTQLRKKRGRSRQRKAHVEDIFRTTTFSDTEADGVEETNDSQPARPETISGLVAQLLNIVRPRFCSNHKRFMTEWSELELEAYHDRWIRLLRIIPTSRRNALRFADVPWPIIPALAITSPSSLLITRPNVTRFLVCPHRDPKDSLESIFTEIERWDDFQLMNCILRKVHEQDRKMVEEAWSRVVLVLMEMRGEYLHDQ